MKPNKKKTILELRKIFKSNQDKRRYLVHVVYDTKRDPPYDERILYRELEEKVEACLKKNKLWYFYGINPVNKDYHGGDQLVIDYTYRMLTVENLLTESDYTWYED